MPFDTGVGNRSCLTDIHLVINETGKNLYYELPTLHAFSACYSTSTFIRKDTKTVLKKNPGNILNLLKHSCLSGGLSIGMNPYLSNWMSSVVCCVLNQQPLISMFFDMRNSCRHSAPNQEYSGLCTVVMILLPPCKDAMEKNLRRTNYQASVFSLVQR